MQVISEEQWEALPERERNNWVLYNPSLQDKAVGQLLNLANMGIDGINQVFDLYENVKVLPDPSPAEQLDTFLQPFKDANTAFAALEKLSIPGISTIINTFKAVFKVIGAVFQMLLLAQKQLTMYSDALIQAYDNVDWDRIEENYDNLTNGNKEANTPGIEATIGELNNIEFPTEKIKQDCTELGNQVQQCTESLISIMNLKKIYEPIIEAQRTFTWENFLNQLKVVTSLLGLDFDQLTAEVDQTTFKDPSKQTMEVSNKINSLMKNKQYIKKADMDILIKKRQEAEKKKEIKNG